MEKDEWRAMQAAAPQLHNPFLSAEFTLAVGRAREAARVAVLEEGQQVVGFLPYELAGFGVGKAIGAGLSDCQGLICRPGCGWDPRAFLRGCGLAVWEFDHLVGSQLPLFCDRGVRWPSPVMDLVNGYEAYLEGRRLESKKIVKTTFWKQRKMQREVGDIRFDFDCRDLGTLSALIRWKSAQYARMLEYDRFADPRTVEIVEDLFHTQTAECAGTLSVMYAADRPVAAHFGLRSSTVLACWFPAYDGAFAKYSPGLQLHFMMAEAAAARGIRYLDLGKGHLEYKESLKSGDLEVAEGWISRPHPTALVRRMQRAPHRHLAPLIKRHPTLHTKVRRAQWRLRQLRSAS
jgi:CelD/BcsL family acetyltransferase involved in cellulose biosynthesis